MLALQEHSYRISVERGSLFNFGEGLSGHLLDTEIKARVNRVSPPELGEGESDAWILMGTAAEATATLSSMRYEPPGGFDGQDTLRLSGSCAVGGVAVTLTVSSPPRNPRLSCDCELVPIEVQRGGDIVTVPPCRVYDDYGFLPPVLQMRASTAVGELALWPISGFYYDQMTQPELLHNMTSQIQMAGPGELMRLALASRLFFLQVLESELRDKGLLVLSVMDVRFNLSSFVTCDLHIVQTQTPRFTLQVNETNTSFTVGEKAGFELTIPPVAVWSASTASSTPCLVLLRTPFGQMRPWWPRPTSLTADWTMLANGTYLLRADRAADASAVLGGIRFAVTQEDLALLPARVPLTVSVYALKFAEARTIEDSTLRDERILYLDLKLEPYVPLVRVGVDRLEVRRGSEALLASLGLSISYDGPMAARLMCNACEFQDDTRRWASGHKLFGSPGALVAQLSRLQLIPLCRTCTADELVITVWDPVAREEDSKLMTSFLTSSASVGISVLPGSPPERSLPRLSILSKGFPVKAGELLDLAGVVRLRVSDPGVPLDHGDINTLVDGRVSCRSGSIAVNVASLAGTRQRKVPDGSRMSAADNDTNVSQESAPASAGTQAPPHAGTGGVVWWRGSDLQLHGRVADVSLALSTLTFTATAEAEGAHEILVSVGGETDSIPIFVYRQPPGSITLRAPPLVSTEAGEDVRPGASLRAGHSLLPTDGLEVRASCGHGTLAVWSIDGETQGLAGAITFAATVAELNHLLANLTYTPNPGFLGMDRILIEVATQRLHAAGRSQVAQAGANIAVVVRAKISLEGPAALHLPEYLSLYEDRTQNLPIELEPLHAAAPSGMALISVGLKNPSPFCLRALLPESFLFDTIATPAPCDLFSTTGTTFTPGQPCMNCTLRPATMPEQCLTWEDGNFATVAQVGGAGWALSACRNWGELGYEKQFFFEFGFNEVQPEGSTWTTTTYPGVLPGTRMYCLAQPRANSCVRSSGMTVTGEVYRGLPTVHYAGQEEVCSGELADPSAGGASRCDNSLRCEHQLDLGRVADPAPGCDRELHLNFTCPNGRTLEVRRRVPVWQHLQTVSIVLQCPVVLAPSSAPVVLRGSLQHGTFKLHRGFSSITHARRLTDCPPDERRPDRDPKLLATRPGAGAKAVPVRPSIQLSFDANVRYGRGRAWLQEVEHMHPPAYATKRPPPMEVALTFHMTKVTGVLPADLEPLTTYELVVEPGVVEGMSANAVAGLGGAVVTFTTGIGQLRPAAWRVESAGHPMHDAGELVGPEVWRVAELQLFAEAGCAGPRLRGTPISSGRQARAPRQAAGNFPEDSDGNGSNGTNSSRPAPTPISIDDLIRQFSGGALLH